MPNNKLTGPVWFIPTVVEIYKDEKGISGKDAANYLLETGAMWYLTEAWKGLHVTGPLYIVDSIDEFIRNRYKGDAKLPAPQNSQLS